MLEARKGGFEFHKRKYVQYNGIIIENSRGSNKKEAGLGAEDELGARLGSTDKLHPTFRCTYRSRGGRRATLGA